MHTRSLADWLAYIERIHPKSIDMGLERIGRVAARLGLGRPARKVVTVAGTNGKGSTVAFIEAIARAGGRRVGAYTSPHLLAYNERIRIDGRDASDADLIAAFEAIEAARLGQGGEPGRAAAARSGQQAGTARTVARAAAAADNGDEPIALTYFEYGTLAALWLFQRAGLDLAILEVGLGGRLDATNLVDADVAVITTVDLDHQDYLGEDREAIGREKAGIARGWTPLVLGDDDPPSSVLRHAYAIGAGAVRAGCDFFFAPLDERDEQGRPLWRWREVGYRADLPMPALAAPAQLRNAAVAIAALRALGPAPSRAQLAEGVAAAHVPGRLQRFQRDGVEVVVDVGHNPQAARELAAWLAAAPGAGRTRAVFAALGDKDAAGVAAALDGRIDAWHLAGLADAGPRGLAVDAFAERLRGSAASEGRRHAGVAAALEAALAESAAGDRVLVFGSFHTAAAALAWLAPR